MIRLALILSLLASSAASRQRCGLRNEIIQHLKGAYGERLQSVGTINSQGGMSVLEVWSSAETETFTILITKANGIACIACIAVVGHDYHLVAEPTKPAGNPL